MLIGRLALAETRMSCCCMVEISLVDVTCQGPYLHGRKEDIQGNQSSSVGGTILLDV